MTTRHFVDVAGRRVHYSRAGAGPPVVLIHESPCAAASLAVLQAVFAERFTALAFDTPGYGLSDPLPLPAPEIADYADALAAVLTALGIGRTAVYGRHTGASIALEFGRRHPDRCALVIPDGLPIYAGPQLESRLTDYLVPLEPRWDGSHLVWLWFRYREQHSFWPWHAQDGAHRSDQDVPDPAYLHRGVLEFLAAGDGYRTAYAAAFRHGGEALAALAETRVPVCVAAREGDSLFRTLTQVPPGTWTAALARDEAAAARQTLDLLGRHPGDPTVPPPPPHAALTYVPAGGHALLLRRANGDRPGTPTLLLHDAGSSSAALVPLLDALPGPALAFDLPGHGESDAALPDVHGWATAVLGALDALGLPAVHVYAQGAGAATGVEMATMMPGRIASLTLGGPPLLLRETRAAFAAGYAPDLAPCWDAGHLLRAWHHLRDQELWFPWHDRTPATARPGEPDIAPARLNRRVRAALSHPTLYQRTWQAALSYPLVERLAALPQTRIAVATRDVFGPTAAAVPEAVRIAAGCAARAAFIAAVR